MVNCGGLDAGCGLEISMLMRRPRSSPCKAKSRRWQAQSGEELISALPEVISRIKRYRMVITGREKYYLSTIDKCIIPEFRREIVA